MSARNRVYLQGETATFTVVDNGYSAVGLMIGGVNVSTSAQMTLADGKWTHAIDTKDLAGAFRFAIFADGKLVEEGAFSVRMLVSKYRQVVAAIDEAMQKAGANGALSVTIGEVSLSNKSFEEMQKWRAYYQNLAVAEESGVSPDASATPKREDIWI